MKIVRLKNNVTVILNDGTMLSNNSCTDEMYNSILKNQNDEEKIRCILIPEFCKKKEEIEIKTKLLDNFTDSKYLSVFGNSVYIKSISELTVPEDLAVALFKAEQEENQELIDTYLNFWTLASLNPDSRARTNLFWFLNKYGMTISKSGLFVAYRNVELKSEGSEINSELAKFIGKKYAKIKFKWKKSPKDYAVIKKIEKDLKLDDYILKLKKSLCLPGYIELGTLEEMYNKLSDASVAPIYTDSYTKTFTIKIGEPVTIDRSKCDSKQENTCSRGLNM